MWNISLHVLHLVCQHNFLYFNSYSDVQLKTSSDSNYPSYHIVHLQHISRLTWLGSCIDLSNAPIQQGSTISPHIYAARTRLNSGNPVLFAVPYWLVVFCRSRQRMHVHITWSGAFVASILSAAVADTCLICHVMRHLAWRNKVSFWFYQSPLRRIWGDQPWPHLPASLVHSSEQSRRGLGIRDGFWVLFVYKNARPNWDANSWQDVLSVDMNSLSHLPRRSSKNCDMQYDNCDRQT